MIDLEIKAKNTRDILKNNLKLFPYRCCKFAVTEMYEKNFEIIKGQRVCLVGPNGAGKSTLLKMLAGVLNSDEGIIKLGYNVERGYFSQTRLDVLSENRTAFDEVSSARSSTINVISGVTTCAPLLSIAVNVI